MSVRELSKNKVILGFVFWLMVSFLVAWFGAQFTTGQWYTEISKPGWTPPGWIFGPVWSILYILMAVSAWLVWKTNYNGFKKTSIKAYLIKMFLNGLWSFIFFGLHEIGWAVVNIFLLFILIIIVIILFYRENKTAGIILLPYALWVGFASALNFKIYLLN